MDVSNRTLFILRIITLIIFGILFLAAGSTHAESPVGGGAINRAFDNPPCYSWTGNTSGASWSRCAPAVVVVPAAQPPQPPAPEVKCPTEKCIIEQPKKIGG